MILESLSATWVTLVTLVVTSVIICRILFQRRPIGVPAGPTTLPILGNLHLFREDPRRVLEQLREKYGDIYSIYFGKELAVVIHGFDKIKEAFVKHGDVFSGRPSNRLTEQVCPDKGLISLSGEKWRKERTLTIQALGDLGFRKALVEGRISEEISCFVNLLEENVEAPFDISLPIHTSISNVICSFILGKRFEHGDQTFQDYINRLLANYRAAGATAALNYLPFLDYLPGDLFKFKRTLHNILYIVDFIRTIVQDHMKTFDPSNVRDFIDAYVKRVEESGSELNEEQLIHAISHLFVAGTESVSTAIRWILLYLCKFTDVQKKIHEEIDSALVAGEPVGWDDRDRLPFTMATTMEVMRHADLAPLGVAHSATEDTHFRGHFIPKGTMIIPYMHGVLHDKQFWGDPEEFRPQRFLNENGSAVIPEQFVPFAIGRRTCLGEHLAKMEIFLFVASILKTFSVRLADGPQPELSDSKMGLTVAPVPFKLVFSKRDVLHFT